MEQIRKIASNILWFKPIVQKSRINYKNAHKEMTDFDESKVTREQFYEILKHISMQAEIVAPTKQEAYELFDEYNDLDNGKEKNYLQKQQFQKFTNRIIGMLEATFEK